MLSNEKDPTVSRGNGLFVRSITATEVHGGCQLGDTGSKDLPSCLLERNPSNEPRHRGSYRSNQSFRKAFRWRADRHGPV